ncbi:FG-GAP-like repeat-containing protein [Myxococcota bacterium]|nr:FG-GAP-like repeat-containing protein [Myxococcota bacterium]
MLAALSSLVLLLASCKDDPAPDARPPQDCHDSSAWTLGKAFEKQTDDWGLADVRGVKMSAADLDGDGYPDLVVNEGAPFARDDFEEGVRYHWVLMNVDDGAGGRTFQDQTEESGLFTPREGDGGRASQIHVFGDVDNDGDLDAFAGAYHDRNNEGADPGDRTEILLNDGSGRFTLAEQSDTTVDDGFATSGASFADVDADGDLDLWVTGWYEQYGYLYGEQDRLYLGRGDGTFDEVTEDAGLEMERGSETSDWVDGIARRPAYGATTCDLDGDALPDLLASNYGRSPNQQWMNQGDGSFVDTSLQSGFSSDDNLDYSDNQYYACWCAYNGPCDPDPGSPMLSGCETFQTYWTPGFDDQWTRLAGNSFTTACGDVDNDGDNDLISAEIVHWHIGLSSDPSELLLNDGTGVFTRPGLAAAGMEREWETADWNAGDLYVAFADLDADGWKDIVLASSDYPDTRMFVWRQVAAGVFEDVAEAWGLDHPWPAGIAIADFDRDGDLDLVTGSSTARSGTPWESHEVHLYENRLGPGNTLRVKLQGEGSNRAGIGATVQVTAGGLTQTYEVGGGYGHFGMQHDTVLHVGLDAACAAEEVTVTWPGGAVDNWTDMPANYQVTLAQGGAATWEGWAPAADE